jgi:hypothetical protein
MVCCRDGIKAGATFGNLASEDMPRDDFCRFRMGGIGFAATFLRRLLMSSKSSIVVSRMFDVRGRFPGRSPPAETDPAPELLLKFKLARVPLLLRGAV